MRSPIAFDKLDLHSNERRSAKGALMSFDFFEHQAAAATARWRRTSAAFRWR